MRRSAQLLLLVLALFGAANPAFADEAAEPPPTAAGQARLAAGNLAYNAGDFARAATEYAAGFAADGWNGFLFMRAQALRQLGDCPTAVTLYNRFRSTSPPQVADQRARDGIAACGGRAAVVTPPPPLREGPFPHKLGVILIGSGLAAGGVGVVYALRARSDSDHAQRQDTLPEAKALYERAQDRTLIARISVGVGAALVVAGIVRILLHEPEASPSPSLVLVPGGLGVSGRF